MLTDLLFTCIGLEKYDTKNEGGKKYILFLYRKKRIVLKYLE